LSYQCDYYLPNRYRLVRQFLTNVLGSDINCWKVSLKDFPVLDTKTKTVTVTIKLQKAAAMAYIGFFNETVEIPRNPVIAPMSGKKQYCFKINNQAPVNYLTFSAIVEEFSSSNSTFFYSFGSKPSLVLPSAGTDTFTIHFAAEDLTVYRHVKQVLADPFVALTAIGGAVSLLGGVRDKVVNAVKSIAGVKNPPAPGEAEKGQDIEMQKADENAPKKKKFGLF
jgi:hypothetical protein